ncbi:hypothetical protein [Halobacillus sp. Marseille-Q1614]|uniref:hypothetical protein n=1 Tax=Halobacillus sp. Marseille-Q1614 TaxID=2709134 RepID=UPI001570517A|nr:hypothetical protein [Halobacillus sp. Marseille-Q1614]
MNKIAIIGSAGSGKSTLARQLGKILDIEVVHMDRLFWNPGWLQSTQEELRVKQEFYLKKDQWIIEGNYSKVWNERLALADTIIMIDLNRYLCLYRVVKRWLHNYGRTREDIGEGCVEKLDKEFVQFVWQFPKKKRSKLISAQLQHCSHAQIIILPSRKSAEKYLNKLHSLKT